MVFPKWATPRRRASLVELWVKHGSACLQGHPLCSNLEHYAHTEHKAVTVSVPVRRECYDKDGNPIPDLFLDTFAIRQVGVTTTELIDAYSLAERTAIQFWTQDDREERSRLRELENRQWHALPKIRKRGPFDSIRREIFLGKRPLFQVVGVGVSGLSYKRTAQIVVPGLFKTVLWVDLSNVRPEGSKNRRRKLSRYKKGVAPQSVEAQINESCRRVAIAYLEKASRA